MKTLFVALAACAGRLSPNFIGIRQLQWRDIFRQCRRLGDFRHLDQRLDPAGRFAYQSNNDSGSFVLPNYADNSWGLVSDYGPSTGQQSFGLLNLGNSNSNPNRSLGSRNNALRYRFRIGSAQ